MSCACQYFVAIFLFYYYHTAPKKPGSGVSPIDLCSCNVQIPTCFTYTLESALWFLEWLNHVDTYEVRLWFECVFFHWMSLLFGLETTCLNCMESILWSLSFSFFSRKIGELTEWFISFVSLRWKKDKPSGKFRINKSNFK